jgi:hypothetical protein
LRSVAANVSILGAASLACALLAAGGCASPWQTAGAAVGVTAAGAQAPSTEIEQIYYLGVFDPREQVPPMIYRVRVHGQASFISLARFASGWVPAQVADSLSSQIQYGDNGTLQVMKQDDQLKSSALQAGRRLVLFGPEGFREAPRDQRLVIIMGTDPSKYFAAVNKVLSKTTTNSTTQPDPNLSAKILAGLVDSEGQTAMIGQLLKDLDQSTK